MENDAINVVLKHLINLTTEISQGNYEQANAVFEYTRTGDHPPLVEELAESFGMMMVKVEAREFRLTQLIEELRTKNVQLEATLQKVKLLENIKAHLGKCVPESVKRLIETAPESPDLEKRDRDVSVLFLDIAGYTSLSETVELNWMNYLIERYFSSFLDDIYQNKGDINETAGDGLMIIFQDDDPVRHACNAAATAIAIQHKVHKVNQDLKGSNKPISVNIGINSGLASVGSTRLEGFSGTRWSYTASGMVTNIAARVGALATEGRIFIGPETAHRIRDKFPILALGKQQLKNVSELVLIHQLVVEKSPSSEH
ncbi:MAG: adenylate/guanylate cyclase domain-containing protein [Deltaproteobacteria bacterium]|nr:adenylate/guanylate cyclase domain-containing protein [Deltaproteobacteria bacterium]